MKFQFPFLKEAVANLFSKPSTRDFPKHNVEAAPNYRGRIAYDAQKCVNCGMCIKVCSPGAITRTVEEVEGGENITYSFDMTSCTFCAMCQDFCTSKAIELTGDYHMVAQDPDDLVVTSTRFKEKVAGRLACGDACVYCGLCAKVCPEGAITVDRASKTWKVDDSKCVKCGLCISKCPKKCLDFAEAVEGVILGDACVYCGLCAKKCPENAITVDRASKTWKIDREACVLCGACVTACPKKTLSVGIVDTDAEACQAAAAPEAPKAEEPKAEAPKAEAVQGKEGVILGDTCVYCTLCAKKCPVNAIQVDRAAKTWEINREECIQCGACVTACPKKALSMGPVEATAEAKAPEAPKAEEPKEEATKAEAAQGKEGVILGDACVYCTLCAKKCPVSAIKVDRAAKTWEINRDECILCGACVSACPKKALSMGTVE